MRQADQSAVDSDKAALASAEAERVRLRDLRQAFDESQRTIGALYKEVARLQTLKDSELLVQDRVMPDHHRSALLEKLREPDKRPLVLAVQGPCPADDKKCSGLER